MFFSFLPLRFRFFLFGNIPYQAYHSTLVFESEQAGMDFNGNQLPVFGPLQAFKNNRFPFSQFFMNSPDILFLNLSPDIFNRHLHEFLPLIAKHLAGNFINLDKIAKCSVPLKHIYIQCVFDCFNQVGVLHFW